LKPVKTLVMSVFNAAISNQFFGDRKFSEPTAESGMNTLGRISLHFRLTI
jgi:hypothetical protein